MSDIQPTITGFISPYGDYNLRNTQALSGVSHIWQDFFARALAEQSGEVLPESLNFPPVDLDSPVEPTVGSDLLAHIVSQRECDVKDNRGPPARAAVPADCRVRNGPGRQAVPTVPAGRNRRSAKTAGLRKRLGAPDRADRRSAGARSRPGAATASAAPADRRIRTRSAGQALPAVLARRAGGATETTRFR